MDLIASYFFANAAVVWQPRASLEMTIQSPKPGALTTGRGWEQTLKTGKFATCIDQEVDLTEEL